MSEEAPTGFFIPWTKDLYHIHILPLVIGSSLGFILYGIALDQFFHVFKLYRERGSVYSKSWWVLMILFWLSLGDSINKLISFVTYLEDAALVGPLMLFKPPVPATLPVALFQGILTNYVQLIYVNRIVRTTRGMSKFDSSHRRARIVTFTCLWIAGALILTSFVGFIYHGVLLTDPINTYFPKMLIPAGISLGCACTTDVILCALMVYNLQRHKGKSGFEKTNFMASKFIKLTLETGLAPTLAQILELIFFFTKSRSTYWAGTAYVVARVYVVSALVLYEAALSGSHPTSSHSHERNRQTSRDISRGRFRDQILVTSTSMQHEDTVEQAIRIGQLRPPSPVLDIADKKNQLEGQRPDYDV